MDFTIEPSQFVSWIDVGDEDGGKGEDRQATALDGLRQGAGRLINSVNQGGQAVGGQLYAQMKRLTDDLSAPPPPPYCCPYPYRYCTLTPSLPTVAPTHVPTPVCPLPAMLMRRVTSRVTSLHATLPRGSCPYCTGRRFLDTLVECVSRAIRPPTAGRSHPPPLTRPPPSY